MPFKHAELDPGKLRKEESELFAFWETTLRGFIPDGCADPEQYAAAPVRLLFVLKEVNGGEKWDLRNFMREGCRARTWDVIARWIQGIFALEQEHSWQELKDRKDWRRKTYIPQVAAVNLKKTPGTYEADAKMIQQFAEENKAFLRKQLSIYQADVIILCGTESAYQTVMGGSPDWRMTTRGIRYHVNEAAALVVSFAHPEARVDKCLLHYGLIDAIREIVAEG